MKIENETKRNEIYLFTAIENIKIGKIFVIVVIIIITILPLLLQPIK